MKIKTFVISLLCTAITSVYCAEVSHQQHGARALDVALKQDIEQAAKKMAAARHECSICGRLCLPDNPNVVSSCPVYKKVVQKKAGVKRKVRKKIVNTVMHPVCKPCMVGAIENGSLSTVEDRLGMHCPICKQEYTQKAVDSIDSHIQYNIRFAYAYFRNKRINTEIEEAEQALLQESLQEQEGAEVADDGGVDDNMAFIDAVQVMTIPNGDDLDEYRTAYDELCNHDDYIQRYAVTIEYGKIVIRERKTIMARIARNMTSQVRLATAVALGALHRSINNGLDSITTGMGEGLVAGCAFELMRALCRPGVN